MYSSCFLDHNFLQIELLPHTLGQLHNLTCLKLDRNLLTKLPVSLGKLSKLRYVILSAYYCWWPLQCKIFLIQKECIALCLTFVQQTQVGLWLFVVPSCLAGPSQPVTTDQQSFLHLHITFSWTLWMFLVTHSIPNLGWWILELCRKYQALRNCWLCFALREGK